MPPWNNFEDKYCCPYLLDPTDPLFNTIGVTFMQEVRLLKCIKTFDIVYISLLL